MAEIFITRRVFRDAIDILKKERHTIDINDSDRILPVRELVKRAHGRRVLSVCSTIELILWSWTNLSPLR